MKKLTLERHYKKDSTTGFITLQCSHPVKTLELPNLDNQVNISCIPEGSYIVRRDNHGRHQWYTVQDVPGRTFIEIHEGSKVSHSNGCILMSRSGIGKIIAAFGDDSFILEIKKFRPLEF